MKETQRQLSELSLKDSLTGLPNRRGGEQRLDEAVARSRRTGGKMAVMFLDIDRFKLINDTHGHATGDEVLRQFAIRLRTAVRVTDTVARLGGDEFIVILEGLSVPEEPLQVANKILAQISAPLRIAENLVPLATSIGVATSDGRHATASALLATADKALYRAKAAGRGRVEMTSA